MIKRILSLLILKMLLLQSLAFAGDTAGEVVFKDALYGAAIGAILGGSIYLADQDDFGAKMGIGIAVGTLGGLFFGVSETRGAVEIRKGRIDLNPPMVAVGKRDGATVFSAKILKMEF